MAEPKQPDPVMLIVTLFGQSTEVLEWAIDQLGQQFGDIELRSDLVDFSETTYYEPDMGPGLRLLLIGFRVLIPREKLAEIKLFTNELEQQATKQFATNSAVQRPVNLDPGYLTAGQFVLATTKNQVHRIYIGRGIFAEITLKYSKGKFRVWPWTYPNYHRQDYQHLLERARIYYMQELSRHLAGASEQD